MTFQAGDQFAIRFLTLLDGRAPDLVQLTVVGDDDTQPRVNRLSVIAGLENLAAKCYAFSFQASR